MHAMSASHAALGVLGMVGAPVVASPVAPASDVFALALASEVPFDSADEHPAASEIDEQTSTRLMKPSQRDARGRASRDVSRDEASGAGRAAVFMVAKSRASDDVAHIFFPWRGAGMQGQKVRSPSMSWFSADDWATLASALGLTPFAPTAGYTRGMCFPQVRRTMGTPHPPEPSYAHRLGGMWKGVPVVVLTYDQGSGSNQTTYTGVLAEVDPPVFMGLSVEPHGPLDGLFGRSDIALGDAAIDDRLSIGGFSATAIRELFRGSEDGRVAVGRLLHAVPYSPYVTDSVVDLSRAGTLTEPASISERLDVAVGIARALGRRRTSLTFSPEQEAQAREWQTFADSSGFAFDRARMRLTGTATSRVADALTSSPGGRVEVTLETEPGRVLTAVSVRFPSAVGFGFTVRRTKMPSFLQGLFGQDIRIGVPAFDDLYLVTGAPEERVRELLARKPVPDILAELGRASDEVEMHQDGLLYRMAGSFPTSSQLAALVSRGQLTSSALFGEMRTQGPYR